MKCIILKKSNQQYAQRPRVTKLILRVRALLKTRWLYKEFHIPYNPVSYRKLECNLCKNTVALSIENRGGVTINNKKQRCGRRSTNFMRHFYDFGDFFDPIYSSNLLRLAATKRLGGLYKKDSPFVNVKIACAVKQLDDVKTEYTKTMENETSIHTYLALIKEKKDPNLFMQTLPTRDEIQTYYNNIYSTWVTPGKPVRLVLDTKSKYNNKLIWEPYVAHFEYREDEI